MIRYERTLDGARVSVVANLGSGPETVPVTNAVLGERTARALLVSDPIIATSSDLEHEAEPPAASAD